MLLKVTSSGIQDETVVKKAHVLGEPDVSSPGHIGLCFLPFLPVSLWAFFAGFKKKKKSLMSEDLANLYCLHPFFLVSICILVYSSYYFGAVLLVSTVRFRGKNCFPFEACWSIAFCCLASVIGSHESVSHVLIGDFEASLWKLLEYSVCP